MINTPKARKLREKLYTVSGDDDLIPVGVGIAIAYTSRTLYGPNHDETISKVNKYIKEQVNNINEVFPININKTLNIVELITYNYIKMYYTDGPIYITPGAGVFGPFNLDTESCKEVNKYINENSSLLNTFVNDILEFIVNE